ncbi:DUF1194 domain-containing protein [Microvirga sp. BT688]|uniref:DUF1194 domain-containing protein n=1 Tax=Microvirga sp. TaxID=1873136 RepID=UPI0016834CF3|nr:DUF1194 domain-containing protein [Microvirga sp.]MBD2746106.1 DUF1194 domain-containing protein [Microvirga sp.]
MPGRHHGACLGLSLVCLWSGAAAGAEATLDLALVLAVDVSSSMTSAEQELQRSGFIEAFRSPAVHKAIVKGSLGRVAVVYVEWSGADEQVVLVPWTVVDGPEAARSFADTLGRKPLRPAGMTSISGVIDFGMRLFTDLKDEPARRVIDISGDGPNNDGRKVRYARDRAVAEGITINGLPIQIEGTVRGWDVADLDRYYADCVIGGPGSFMIPLRHADQFPSAIKAKILREIAGSGGSSLFLPTGAQADCLSGEKRRTEEEAWEGEGNP